MASTALLLISDREPLAWVLSEQRFALPRERVKSVPAVGSRLLLYTTRGCYRNPTRDRGMVMGLGTVLSEAVTLDRPVELRDQSFPVGFDLSIEGVAPPHDGVDLGNLAGQLDTLPDTATWSARMRTTFLALSVRDTRLLVARLRPMLLPLHDLIPAYLVACKVVADAAHTRALPPTTAARPQ